MSLFALARPLIHLLNPETTHRLGIKALAQGWLPAQHFSLDPALATRVFGLSFPHPLGLAAGFDKNAECVPGLFAQGFGFIEVGTVTPQPQHGNPRPRIFRLKENEAVINRLGFNNKGLDRLEQNLRTRPRAGVLGVNIGRNRDQEDAVADYVTLVHRVAPYADYITVNVSSPNTEGLRNLQQRQALDELLQAVAHARNEAAAKHSKALPLLLKIAPDLDAKRKEDIAEVVLARGIEGLIVSNTTIQRPHMLTDRNRNEQGGLSGRPLFSLSTETLCEMYRLTQGKIPLIGVGGIFSAEDAYVKIRAGASLVQLYTALVYHGFAIVPKIVHGLAGLLKRDGFKSVSDAVGVDNR